MNTIYFFSGTGNSLQCAKDIAKEIDAQILPIDNYAKVDAEIVGIIFPCYCDSAPKEIFEFIQNADIKAKYIFSICTCGASGGNSHRVINEMLKEKKLFLNFAQDFIMPDNCIIFASKLEDIQKLKMEYPKKIDELKEKIKNKSENQDFILAKSKSMTKSKLLWLGLKAMGVNRKKINNKCIKCRLCESLCPKDAIKLNERKKFNKAKCANCFRCIQFCPSNAITFGAIKREEGKRWLNPSCTVKEILSYKALINKNK